MVKVGPIEARLNHKNFWWKTKRKLKVFEFLKSERSLIAQTQAKSHNIEDDNEISKARLQLLKSIAKVAFPQENTQSLQAKKRHFTQMTQ